MEIGDEVLYFAYSRDSNPIRVGKIVDIIEFKDINKFFIVEPCSGGRTLSRKSDSLFKLSSIEQLKKDIIQRRNNGNRN